MRVLVTFAVEAEFAPWRKLRAFRKMSGSNMAGLRQSSFFELLSDNLIVDVLLTGIGETTCQQALSADRFLSIKKPSMVISSGLAGALKLGLTPGNLIVPQTVRTLKNDANATAEGSLREQAIQQGALPIETMITVNRIVSTIEEKERLSFFGEAVDMESAIVMSHFAAAGVPVVAIRAISDAANENLPIDFDRCLTPQGAIKPLSLVNAIVQGPRKLPKLVQFGRQSYQAAVALAKFLDMFIAALPAAPGNSATV